MNGERSPMRMRSAVRGLALSARTAIVGWMAGLCLLGLCLVPVPGGAQEAAPSPPEAAAGAASPAETPAASGSAMPSFTGPLAPPDVSSPRATLQGFRASVAEAGTLLIQAYEEQQATPGLFSPVSAVEKAERAEKLLARAARAFDFSQVPPASLRSVRTEAVLLLKEILDRIALPPLASIPDAQMIEEEAEREREPPLPSWTVPGTEITFNRMAGGTTSGSYLVSPQTILRLEEFYNIIGDRPLRPNVAEDLYDFYSMTPGMLLPPKWLEAILHDLPDWAQDQYLDEAIWQWIALVGGALFCVALVFVAFRIERDFGEPGTPLASNLRSLLLAVLILIVSYLYDRTMDEIINVTGPVLRAVDAITYAIDMVALAWLAIVASNSIAEWILESPKIPSGSLDANLLRAAFRVIGIGAAAVLLGIGATNLGIPLVGVIAGLGVGGLAIALAAQPTIENFIGGIILYADRPVRVGDDCQFGDMRGFVEEIGIRSTRIRGKWDRTLITVPNADFAKMRLINFSRRDRMELVLTIGLRYETTPDQLRYVLTRFKELLYAHPLVIPQAVSVRFATLASSSLDIEVRGAFATRSFPEFQGVREDLFLRFIDVVNEAGTGFAFPSRTLYLAADSGLEAEGRDAAAQAVRTWREETRLPFPDLPDGRMQELRSTLDWPPAGAAPVPKGSTEPRPPAKRRRADKRT